MTTCRPTRFRRRPRKGAAIVELALALPVLVAVLFGVIEMGQSMRVASILSEAACNAATEAARPDGTTASATTEARTALTNGGLTVTAATVTVRVNDVVMDAASAQRNDKITVSVSLPWTSVSLSGSTWFFPASGAITGSNSMLKQR